MSLGIRSGRELDALERKVQDFREAAHEQRLGEARHADHQHMPLHGQRDEQVADNFLLANDALAQFRRQLLVQRGHLAQQLHLLRVGISRGNGSFSQCIHES